VIEWFGAGSSLEVIPVSDRGLQYGDGLFETVAIRDRSPRLWDYHLERLQTGGERLGLPVPSRQAIENELENAIDTTSIATDRCTVKIIVTSGSGPRGYPRPLTVTPTLLIGVSTSVPLPENLYRQGVRVRVCDTRLAIQPQLAGIKSLNRLEQVLARNEWQDDSVFEGLLLDTDDRLICGTMSNVFLIDGNSLATPAVTRCGVAGVMRRHLLSLLEESGFDCEVRDIASDEIDSCAGILLCNSQFGILPVCRCSEKTLAPGELAAQVVLLVAASGIREHAP
jgi:4-amino-4-deoxychorismate lyase